MTIVEHLREFGGFQVKTWEIGQPLSNPHTTIYRLSVAWDEPQSWVRKFRAFMRSPGIEQVRGLVVGFWSNNARNDDDLIQPPCAVIEELVNAQRRLRRLQALFFGDITSEECEISWIIQCDLSPVLAAYPQLTHLGIRGSHSLQLGQVNLPSLRYLVIQSGGLPVNVVREVMNAHLPELEHLELYLGTEDYGATSQICDLKPVLEGETFTKLKYLGIKNSDYQDQIAQAAAQAPVLERLETLDLSLGTLTDEGAQALLKSKCIKQLQKLNLSHHFCSSAMISKLQALDIQVEAHEAGDFTRNGLFVALGE